MKLFFYLILLSLIAACSTMNKPFLWEVEKGGKRSYLFGSIHKGIKASELPGVVHEKFQASPAFGAEVTDELLETDSAKIQAENRKRFGERFKDNKKKNHKATNYFSKEEWLALMVELKPYNVSEKNLQYMAVPVLYNMLIARHNDRLNHGDDSYILSKEMMDKTFVKEATNLNKKIYRLDKDPSLTPDCVDRLFAEEIKESLLVRQNNFERYQRLTSIIKAYKAGDGVQLYRLQKESTTQCLLSERNHRWLDIMEKAFAENESLFIVAGVAHFVGPDNLIDLLLKRGYRVERLTSK